MTLSMRLRKKQLTVCKTRSLFDIIACVTYNTSETLQLPAKAGSFLHK